MNNKKPSSTQAIFPVSPQSLPDRELEEGRYRLRFARTAEELDAVLRLRFEVFNLELQEGLDTSHETVTTWISSIPSVIT